MRRQEWVREGVLLTEATQANLNLLGKSGDNLMVSSQETNTTSLQQSSYTVTTRGGGRQPSVGVGKPWTVDHRLAIIQTSHGVFN